MGIRRPVLALRRAADWSVRTKLNLLGGVALGALLVFAGAAMAALGNVRIGSPRYEVIAEKNLLLADVLPPPAYLVEAELVAHQLLVATRHHDEARVAELTQRMTRLEQDDADRQQYWADSTLIDERTRRMVTEASAAPGAEFLDLVRREYLPALAAGDVNGAEAVLDGPIRSAYERHRRAIDEIVDATAGNVAASEAASRSLAGRLQTGLLAALALTAIGLALLCRALSRTISGPLGELRRRFADIAAGGGDLTARLDDRRGDELGDLARSFNGFVGQLGATVNAVRACADRLVAEASALTEVSSEVSEASSRTENQTDLLQDASHNVSSSIGQVVRGAAEMHAAVSEISRTASEAVQIAGAGVDAAARADETMRALDQASAEIASVVTTITQIAEQTNVLALNATIEAARAGEAGRGFAVVATEVKDLAQGTARATSGIGARVDAIQGCTGQALHALGEIRDLIGEISSSQAIIAAAVEEQTATTREIETHAAIAAGEVGGFADGLAQTVAGAHLAVRGAASTNASAVTVAEAAGELRDLVGAFRT
ncbi:MAG: methyl-accepting chemotaxis protein [Acidimicrobiales bacterium]